MSDNKTTPDSGGARKPVPLRELLDRWSRKIAAAGHEFASGRYPRTARKFATRPPESGAVELEDDLGN